MQSALTQPKRVALLGYLAMATPRGFHRRETLLGMFWPEVEPARARNALNQAVHFLRRSLEEGILISRGDELRVDPDRLRCDAVELEAALDAGRVEAAMALYAGELMPGLHVADAPGFERWLMEQRDRLRGRMVRSAASAAERADAAGDIDAAVQWARRTLQLDPESEVAQRRLMLLLDRAGARAEALISFQAFARRLEENLGLKPSSEMDELAGRIRHASEAATSGGASTVGASGVVGQDAEVPTLAPAAGVMPDLPSRPPGVATRPFRRGAMAAAGVGLLLFLLGAAGVWWRWGTPPAAGNAAAASAAREVLVADFGSPTGDSILARVVTEALKIDLAQSRVVQAVEPRSVRLALARMQRGSDPLTFATARELALREGIDGVATGEISGVGGGFLLSVRLVSPASEQTVAAFRDSARDSADLIPAIDRLSEQLRRGLGESARALRETQPLERVTTASLDALRRYSLAVRAIDQQGDYARGIALLREAVALDPGFAMAHRKLGIALLNSGAPMTAVLDAYDQAYRTRDRLTERERYLVVAAHHGTTLEEAIGVYSALLDRYPSDVYALNNIGYLYGEVGDYRRAAAFYRRAARTDSTFALAPANLVVAEFNRGDTAAARDALARFTERFPDNPWALNYAAELAAATGRYDEARDLAMRLLAEHGEKPDWRIEANRKLAQLAAVQGRVEKAEARLVAAMREAERTGAAGELLDAGIALALLELHARGSRERALQRIGAVLRLAPLASLRAGDRPLTELAWLYAQAGAADRVRELLREVSVTLDPRLRREIERKQRSIQAALRFAEGRYDEAIPVLRESGRSGCPICPLPLLGRAYEGAGMPDSAAAVYRRYLAVPHLERLREDAVWRALVQRRLAALTAGGRRPR